MFSYHSVAHVQIYIPIDVSHLHMSLLHTQQNLIFSFTENIALCYVLLIGEYTNFFSE